jgi:hypothetical protein
MKGAETVVTYSRDGVVYEIDHLGVCSPDTQWGDYVVYRDGVQVAEFSVEASWFRAGCRPPLPGTVELIMRALGAMQG